MAIYLLYAIVFGVIIFNFHEPIVSADRDDQTIDKFIEDEMSQDRVVLLEEGSLASKARIDVIQQAKETIQIAYYTIHNGTVADTFFGAIIGGRNIGDKYFFYSRRNIC